MDSSKFPHSMLGLDPLLRAFVKLYIGDILTLEADGEVKGVYYYKKHPVQRVDVMGVVVKLKQTHRFIKYYVDDGTGVIPVVCWQNEPSHNQHWKQDLPACLSVLLEGHSPVGFELGDLVHVQGKIREFHEEREISSFSMCKCTDPMEEVARMAELPDLYTKVYDKPFQPPQKVLEVLQCTDNPGFSGQESVLMELESQLNTSFSDLKTDRFQLEDLLSVGDVRDVLLKAESGPNTERELVEKALKQMELKGQIFNTHQGVYRVVSLCRDLEEKILSILVQECQNGKYAESGCHVSRVYDILRRHLDFAKVTRVAVEGCLATLESRSDVISTSSAHYIAFGS